MNIANDLSGDVSVHAVEFRQLERRRLELEERFEPLALEDAERDILFDEWRSLLVELRARRRALQARAARQADCAYSASR